MGPKLQIGVLRTEMENFADKNRALVDALEAVEESLENGEYPVVNGERKTEEEVEALLNRLDDYCATECAEKEATQARIQKVRKQIESLVG